MGGPAQPNRCAPVRAEDGKGGDPPADVRQRVPVVTMLCNDRAHVAGQKPVGQAQSGGGFRLVRPLEGDVVVSELRRAHGVEHLPGWPLAAPRAFPHQQGRCVEHLPGAAVGRQDAQEPVDVAPAEDDRGERDAQAHHRVHGEPLDVRRSDDSGDRADNQHEDGADHDAPMPAEEPAHGLLRVRVRIGRSGADGLGTSRHGVTLLPGR